MVSVRDTQPARAEHN